MSAVTHNIRLKLLSLGLAVMLWFVVVWERPAEQEFTARLVYTVPAGFVIKGPLPEEVQIRVSGPKILLVRLAAERPIELRLDLTGGAPGGVTFTNIDRLVPLPRDLRVVRIQPERISLNMERNQ